VINSLSVNFLFFFFFFCFHGLFSLTCSADKGFYNTYYFILFSYLIKSVQNVLHFYLAFVTLYGKSVLFLAVYSVISATCVSS
jgi:hypothetical protein